MQQGDSARILVKTHMGHYMVHLQHNNERYRDPEIRRFRFFCWLIAFDGTKSKTVIHASADTAEDAVELLMKNTYYGIWRARGLEYAAIPRFNIDTESTISDRD